MMTNKNNNTTIIDVPDSTSASMPDAVKEFINSNGISPDDTTIHECMIESNKDESATPEEIINCISKGRSIEPERNLQNTEIKEPESIKKGTTPENMKKAK